MAAAHATQADVLSQFSLDVERFRHAPAYNFAELPNKRVVFHERCEWGLECAIWRRLAVAALRELGLLVTSC